MTNILGALKVPAAPIAPLGAITSVDSRIETHPTSCEWCPSVIRFQLRSDFMRSAESVRIHADFRAHSGFRIDAVCISPNFSMRHAARPFQGRYPVMVNNRPNTEHLYELVHVDEFPS